MNQTNSALKPLEQLRVFETSNLDLAAYLMLEGIPYLGCNVEYDASKRRQMATMKFHDEKQNVRDLERNFMTSSEKRYRDLTKYLLKEVHKEMKKHGPVIGSMNDGD